MQNAKLCASEVVEPELQVLLNRLASLNCRLADQANRARHLRGRLTGEPDSEETDGRPSRDGLIGALFYEVDSVCDWIDRLSEEIGLLEKVA